MAALFVLIQQYRFHYPPDFIWPIRFETVHILAMAAIIALAADYAVTPRPRPRPHTRTLCNDRLDAPAPAHTDPLQRPARRARARLGLTARRPVEPKQ